MCSDASTQTYSQHNAALLKSSPHNLHKLSPVFARISSNNVEILLYPLLTGPLWNCAPQPYWLIVVAVSTWSFPLRFLQNPAPGHFARLFWFCISCHQCQCKKKTVVSVTPGNSCRMTGRPIFVVGRIDFVTLRTRESIIIMDCELIHNCSHSLHQGSVEWHPPSGSSSFIRVGIRQPGPKFSPGIENLFPCRPPFLLTWYANTEQQPLR